MTTAAQLTQYLALEQEVHDRADAMASKDPAQLDLFITALTRAVAMRPSVSSRGAQGDEIRYDTRQLRELLNTAIERKDIVASQASGGFIRRPLERYC